jgi:hypothetical protein
MSPPRKKTDNIQLIASKNHHHQMTSKSKMEYVDWSMIYLYEEKHFNSNRFVVSQTDSVVKKLTNEKVV